MVKKLRHIGFCILSGLFLSVIIYSSASVFDKELSENYEWLSEAYMIEEIHDDNSGAVLIEAFLYDFDLSNTIVAEGQNLTTKKYILFNTNIKILAAYKQSCTTHLNLRPILYTGSNVQMSSYHPYEEYPFIS
jgi:hypothetical protein